jgi:hypothetical protein
VAGRAADGVERVLAGGHLSVDRAARRRLQAAHEPRERVDVSRVLLAGRGRIRLPSNGPPWTTVLPAEPAGAVLTRGLEHRDLDQRAALRGRRSINEAVQRL